MIGSVGAGNDVASTFPIEDLPLAPYNLIPTPPNTTQDCTYDATNKKFLPLQQQYRQPVLLHPLSYHPSKAMAKNTYLSSAFRASKTSTDPSDCLDYLVNKYLPPLVRSGHNATETATKLALTSYFPTPTEKREWEYKPIIRYTWSDTRSNRRQLQPLELKDFHLIPTLPLAPLKSLLAYQPPKTSYTHTWEQCDSKECISCKRYSLFTTSTLAVPITPCNSYRCLYLLHHPGDHEIEHVYLGTTLVQGNSPTNTPGPLVIAEHLSKANIQWQILSLYSSSYKTPHNCQDSKLLEWKHKLEKLHNNILIHQFPWKTSFYKQLHTEFTTQNSTKTTITTTHEC